MNRISVPAPKNDPDRDLYEAPPPGPKNTSWKKTGSNDIPLGKPRAPRHAISQSHGQATLKRRHDDGPPDNRKRPRLNLGRASALVQASLTDEVRSVVADAYSVAATDARVAVSESGRPMIKLEEVDHSSIRTPTTRAPSMGCPEPSRKNDDQVFGVARQVLPTRLSDLPTFATQGSKAIQQKQTVAPSFTHFPLAIWVGTESPSEFSLSADLKKAAQIPSDLAAFLLRELTKHVSESRMYLFNAVELSASTCILSYLVEGTKPRKGTPRARIVCAQCYIHHRPCALLQWVGGVKPLSSCQSRKSFGAVSAGRMRGAISDETCRQSTEFVLCCAGQRHGCLTRLSCSLDVPKRLQPLPLVRHIFGCNRVTLDRGVLSVICSVNGFINLEKLFSRKSAP
ncbi:hypothetical protein T440DRAFT_172471 [Plenodomus tracheiphilus IPT5]|uniref:Uncharacterized protein n=1 Tax=Plenodomus tracheiphilus IPT5 TaxID=1408161 RepID=A0A6A7B1I2_9PLEO|nr:hypothetical protein T440DRAFT_172471 [Plenodomus tracheiphilus IPT5]